MNCDILGLQSYYRQFGYERISKDMVTGLDDAGRQGIDGKKKAYKIREAMEIGDVQNHLFNVKENGRIIVNQLDDMAKKIK